MKAKVLVPIIIGAVVLTVAIIFLILALTVPTVHKTHDVQDAFSSIDIDVSTTDLEFAVSEDGTVKVDVTETEKQYHSVRVLDGILVIRREDARNIFERAYGFGNKFKVVLYLPAGEYGNLNLKVSTGNVTVPEGYTFNKVESKSSTGDISFNSNAKDSASFVLSTGSANIANMSPTTLFISSTTGSKTLSNITVQGAASVISSTGSVTLNNFKCNSLTMSSSTGSTTLNNTIVDNTLSISVSTGNVTLNDADAGTIFIKTTTGNVKGTLLTSKIIFAETNTGHANVPHLTEGGKCEIKTTTGNIEISIKE